MSDIQEELNAPDELSALKTRADAMGISYHPSIGLEKLRAKVNGAIETTTEEPTKEETTFSTVELC